MTSIKAFIVGALFGTFCRDADSGFDHRRLDLRRQRDSARTHP